MAKQFSFGSVPTIKARRTQFDLSHGVKTSMNVGTLYPIYVQEVVPGDTFKVNTSLVTRVTSSFVKPVMDNIYQDVRFFFVPNRLIHKEWESFFGTDEPDAWNEPITSKVPQVGGLVSPGTVADYLGLPTGVILTSDETANGYVSDLPFRAFAKIYNDWYRDENLIDSTYFGFDIDGVATLNNNEWGVNNCHGKLPKVSKFHDYFTSCLPGTQKGQAVSVGGSTVPIDTFVGASKFKSNYPLDFLGANIGPNIKHPLVIGNSNSAVSSEGTVKIQSNSASALTSNDFNVTGSNLVAKVPPISVSDLRLSFQLQKYLEKNARGGTRYTEFILSHFGVQSPDSRLQRSEYLGGSRQPLSIQQVASTNGVGNSLADLGAYSLSNGNAKFNKGFVEHGFIIGVSCLRYKHTYQQGIERFWMRNEYSDFYDPLFSNISEQPVYSSEIYASSGDLKQDVFGYNEAWADMRNRPNRVTGQMRSLNDADNSLDIWHFADEYQNKPILSKAFIEETPSFVDRTLAVPSTTSDQFIVDIWHNVKAIREMPMYSKPGLIDHH